MLYIKIGRPKGDCIIDVTHYFNYKKKKEWFADSFVKKVIKEIDNCEAIKDEYIESPIWGGMSPDRLSTGCKALILMRSIPGIHVYATKCGDNCAPFIMELSREQDIRITLNHNMHFNCDFEAIMVDTNKHVYHEQDYLLESMYIRGVIAMNPFGMSPEEAASKWPKEYTPYVHIKDGTKWGE